MKPIPSRHRRSLFTATLALLLILSGALNWIAFGFARDFYRQANAVRLAPLGLGDYPANRPVSGPAKTAVFFGDSRAFQWPSPEVNGYRFLNRGIGGQTSSQVRARFNMHVAPLQPDFVIVQVGINDLKTLALFPDRQEAIEKNCRENIAHIVAAATETGATVIVTTVFPARDPSPVRRVVWSNETFAAIERVNQAIARLQSEQVIVLDAYSLLVGENGRIDDRFAHDQLHLNNAGYEALNEALFPLLP